MASDDLPPAIDLSFRERSICGSMVAVLVIALGYFGTTLRWLAADTVDVGALIGLSIGALILLIAVQIVFHVLLTLASRPERPDERDRLVVALASRNAYLALQVGTWLVLGHVAAAALLRDSPAARWFAPAATAQLALLAAIAAELTRYGSQLVYYRRGA